MEESPRAPVTRFRLESLSTNELIKLADTYGVDIPPELDRIFITEEILEIANAENGETENPIEVNPSHTESAHLPKQYNISYIEAVIRDPLWVFVFWEIKGYDKEIHENAKDFKGYILKVIQLGRNENESQEMQSTENSFTVSINKEDCARYLGFAGETLYNGSDDSNCYAIKLCALRGNSEVTIASSAPFVLPALSDNEEIANMSRNPLLRISGVQHLSIIKKIDRNIRTKR